MSFQALEEKSANSGEVVLAETVFSHEPRSTFDVLVWKPPATEPHQNSSLHAEYAEIMQRGFLWWAVRTSAPCESASQRHLLAFRLRRSGALAVQELGGIVVDNELTRTLFKWLAQPEDEWWGAAGTHSSDSWREHLLQALCAWED